MPPPAIAPFLALSFDGVLVCDGTGRITAANPPAERLADRGELVGRSALDIVAEPLLRDALAEDEAVGRTTWVGSTLCRLRVAPVAVPDEAEPDGFLLVFRPVEPNGADGTLDRLVQHLTEGVRGPLASIRAAVETVTEYPDMEAAATAQFLAIIREQAVALSRHVEGAAALYAEASRARRPLEHCAGTDLVAEFGRTLRVVGDVPVETEPPPPGLVVRVDRASLRQGLAHLAERVVHATRTSRLVVRLRPLGRMAALDLGWPGPGVRPARLARWTEEPLRLGDAPAPTTLHEVVQRHGGEVLAGTDGDGLAYVRLLLPTD